MWPWVCFDCWSLTFCIQTWPFRFSQRNIGRYLCQVPHFYRRHWKHGMGSAQPRTDRALQRVTETHRASLRPICASISNIGEDTKRQSQPVQSAAVSPDYRAASLLRLRLLNSTSSCTHWNNMELMSVLHITIPLHLCNICVSNFITGFIHI